MRLWPFSKRRTMPRISWPWRSLYSLKMMSRSASRTRCNEHLLGRLRRDAAEGAARLLHVEQVAELFVLLAGALGVTRVPEHLEAELLAELGFEPVLCAPCRAAISRSGCGHVFDDGHVLEQVDVAGVLVEARFELARRTERRLRRLEDRRLHRLDQDLLVDALLLRRPARRSNRDPFAIPADAAAISTFSVRPLARGHVGGARRRAPPGRPSHRTSNRRPVTVVDFVE